MEVKENHEEGGTYANLTTFASLVSGFLLLGTGFFAGWYWQNASVQDVVKVEIVEKGARMIPAVIAPEHVAGAASTDVGSSEVTDCQFVGSKNSDKYHSPESAPAKRIKPENIVCFASEAEALEEGYEAGTIH